jgi:hypothetical protein
MAVYKIFPYKDTTLYSYYPIMNAGMDAISEVYNALTFEGTPDIARFLVQYDQDEITDVISNKINGAQWDVNFKSFIATAQGISSTTLLEIWPVAQEWNNGTGEYLDSPQTTDGASWGFSLYSGSSPWSMGGSVGTELFTGSFDPTYASQGGGNWFYSGSGVSSYRATQSFELRSDKDMSVGVKTAVEGWYSGSIPNYGLIVKLTGSLEFNPSQYVQPIFKYYSVDTNTIYPPQLEFSWVDYSTVLNGPLSGSIVTTTNLKLALNENPGIFYPSSVNRFRLNVSPLYPTRTFQTTSYFTDLYFLPTSSYYAVKDLDTNEYVINFDDQYTQISSDVNGNYFDIYMNGLEPERYYAILIKTIVNGSTIIFDDQYYFKVVNG